MDYFYAIHTIYFAEAGTGAEKIAMAGSVFAGLSADSEARLLDMGAARRASAEEILEAGLPLVPAAPAAKKTKAELKAEAAAAEAAPAVLVPTDDLI